MLFCVSFLYYFVQQFYLCMDATIIDWVSEEGMKFNLVDDDYFSFPCVVRSFTLEELFPFIGAFFNIT